MEYGLATCLQPTDRHDEGLLVVRKRRRPALACEQCRRRKVKCDRTSPCGPCRRSGSDLCTYRPDWRKAADTLDSNNRSRGLDREGGVADWERQLLGPAPEPAASMASPGFANHPGGQRPQASTPSDVSSTDFLMRPALGGGPTSAAAGDSEWDCRPASLRGSFVKSRFHGPSHWINASGAFQYVLDVQREAETDDGSELGSLLKDCKRLCHICKAQSYSREAGSVSTTLASHVPPQTLCDELVRLYLRTFETVYRVLHIPTFRLQYTSFRAAQDSVSLDFIAQLLLVCALGTCLYGESHLPGLNLRASALHWTAAAQAWMSSPSEKARLNLHGLQTRCLLLLAKQALPGGSEMAWISAGASIRAAMLLGLHHSPSKLSDIGDFEAEMRKRLWATIMDLQLQLSIETGGPPMISEADYDCEPPSNLDDVQLDSGTGEASRLAKPMTTFTATSIQCALMRTLPIRLEVAKYLNDFSSEQTFDETLRLGNKLKAVLDENMRLLRSFAGQHHRPTDFQTKFFELLTYRFLLVLHSPYAVEAKKNPRYYFSHKVCLDVSLSLLRCSLGAPVSLATAFQAGEEDYARLQVFGNGLFRNSPLRAVRFVCSELLRQLEDDQGQIDSAFHSLGRQELYRIVVEYVQLLAKRIEAGETTIQAHIFFSGLLAHIDALQASRPSKDEIVAAMKRSLEFCQSMLRANSGEKANSGDHSHHGNVDELVAVLEDAGPLIPESSTTICTTGPALLDSSLWFDLDTEPYLAMEEDFLPL